jgi:hypothetical protein
MPVNVVKTPEDEIAWARAKEAAHREYPHLTPGPRFYRIVMTIYKNMTHRDGVAASRRHRRASRG